ncbi:unnamed protein product, partial [Scytosiphon promiscuus]
PNLLQQTFFLHLPKALGRKRPEQWWSDPASNLSSFWDAARTPLSPLLRNTGRSAAMMATTPSSSNDGGIQTLREHQANNILSQVNVASSGMFQRPWRSPSS